MQYRVIVLRLYIEQNPCEFMSQKHSLIILKSLFNILSPVGVGESLVPTSHTFDYSCICCCCLAFNLFWNAVLGGSVLRRTLFLSKTFPIGHGDLADQLMRTFNLGQCHRNVVWYCCPGTQQGAEKIVLGDHQIYPGARIYSISDHNTSISVPFVLHSGTCNIT